MQSMEFVWVCLCGDWRFVWGLEVCAHLVVGGECVAEVHVGGLRKCWGLCVFVIKSLHRFWVFSVVVRLVSATIHTVHIFSCFTLQKTICCNSTKGLRKRGIQWSMKERLENLDYADDIFLLAQRFCDMKEKLKRLKEEAELVGLHINIKKTKGMRVNNLICKNLD